MPTFECGCRVEEVADYSENYKGSPSKVFDLERCARHSVSAADLGPIDDYIAAQRLPPAVELEAPPPPPKVDGCGRGNHDYVRVEGKRYAKCSKCDSTRTVA